MRLIFEGPHFGRPEAKASLGTIPGHTTILANTSTLLKVRDNTPMSGARRRFIGLRITSP